MATITACRLWKRDTERGPILSGRWGGIKIVIAENSKPTAGDDATHLLLIADPKRDDYNPNRKEPNT